MDHHRESLIKMMGLVIRNKGLSRKMNTAMKKKNKKNKNHTTFPNFIEISQNI